MTQRNRLSWGTALFLSLAGKVVAEVPPAPYAVGWNDTIGLWNHNTNQARHQIRANAWKLVAAGMDGMLDQVPTLRVLNNLRTAQSTTGSRGNFWWNWEDGKITDPNGGFFTGLGLLTLRMEFADDLSSEQLAVLDTLLAELQIYMTGQTASLTEGYLKYPNMALGEVACHWLLLELNGGVTPYYQGRMTTALSYYRDKDWGWGEHLSDLYVKICQAELVALLLYGNGLSAANRALAQSLFSELATIDAGFYGGPRVPTIRCYEMDVSPRTPGNWNGIYKPYLDAMVPWAGQYGTTGYQILSVLGYQHGLHTNLPSGPLSTRTITTDCHGGVKALSVVDARWRFGAMSRYPLAVDSNTKTSGLHWQSMPAAFWHSAGDWGYLQWVARENNETRALPAFSRDDGLTRILSTNAAAAVGETFGLRKDDSLLILRRLPAISAGWPWVKDRFRVVACTATPRIDVTNGWQRLVLPYGQESLTLACRPLAGTAAVAIQPGADGELLWEARFSLPQVAQTNLALVWYMTVSNAPAVPPAFSGDGHTATLTYPDGVNVGLATWHATTPWTLDTSSTPPPDNTAPEKHWKLQIEFTGYSRPEPLTNFPVLVRLGPSISGFDYGHFLSTNATGEINADLRFTDASGRMDLNYEIERWNPAGESLIWVQVPLLATNTDAIYARWGTSGVTAPDCTTNGATWRNGFVGVWHLNSNSGSLQDSTTNAFAGTRRGNTAGVEGMVGGGQSLDGAGDYIEIADRNALSFGNSVTDFPFSLSAWIKPDASTNGFRVISKANGTSSTYGPPPEWRLFVATNGTLSLFLHDASTGSADRLTRVSTTGAVPAGVWSLVCATYDGSTSSNGIALYRNGALVESTGAKGTNYVAMNNTASTVDIGADLRLRAGYEGFADGSADEVRVDHVVRSPAWIWACWTNQVSGSTFLTYGPLTQGSNGFLQVMR